MKKVIYTLILSFIFLIIVPSGLYAEDIFRTSRLTKADGIGVNSVRSIVQDGVGFIWLGTTEGLFRYDGYTLMRILPNSEEEKKLYSDLRLLELAMFGDDMLLLRLHGGTYALYDTKRERFVDYTGNATYSEVYKDFAILNKNEFWLIAADGAGKRIIRNGNSFRSEKVAKVPQKITNERTKRHQVKDALNEEARKFVAENTGHGIVNDILCVFRDRSNIWWMTEEDRGLVRVSKEGGLAHYIYNKDKDNRQDNVIRLLYYDREKGLQYRSNYEDVIVTLLTGKGERWFGSRTNGITVNDHHYLHDKSDPTSISEGKITGFCEDHNGNVWVSFFDARLVSVTDGMTDGRYRFREVLKDIPKPRSMICDRHGQIWVCTDKGIILLDPQTGKHRQIRIAAPVLNSDDVQCIYEDSHGTIWVSVMGYGLAQVDNSKKGNPEVKTIFSIKDGLPSNTVESIIEDRHGNLWLGLTYGLSMYSAKNKRWLSFFPGTTELDCVFNECCAAMLEDGKLAFGSRHGIAIIDPEVAMRMDERNMSKDNGSGKLFLTDILINGTRATALGDDSPVKDGITQCRELNLSYDQNTLQFKVSDFDFRPGVSLRISYMLDGYDEDWSDLETTNTILYQRLSPGDYVLHVRMVNANGIPAENEITLPIHISSPWYTSWWFILLCVAVVAVIARMQYTRLRENQKLKERVYVEQELTKLKMQFFTNVSHEFRTPLTIIRGCMETAWNDENIPGSIKEPISAMKKSVDRMMGLVNQVMTFSKVHDNKLKLRLQDTDIVEFTRDVCMVFNDMAKKKGISFSFSTQERILVIPMDRDYMDKIVFNLVSNAFKFTPRHGEISVKIRTTADKVSIIVADTGIGISAKKKEQLFTRFDQSAFASDSVGVGLHITHQLAKAHHADIEFADNMPHGCIFTVTLPKDHSVYAESEFMSEEALLLQETKAASESVIPDNYQTMMPPPLNKDTVMIVEDDIDVQEYIRRMLQPYFNIIVANDGEEAFEYFADSGKASDVRLLISDAMMPRMGGFELVRKLRQKKEYANLPVIMLTALEDEDKEVRAVNVGVNVYMRKPFSPSLLIAQATQLLNKRNQELHTAAVIEAEGSPAKKTTAPVVIMDDKEKRFRDHFDSWLEKHLGDEDLNVDRFAESMKIGRTTFYKRVRELTGKSPNDYIKQKRMEKALEYLADVTLSVQQVAYRLGYSDPFYFSKTFKAYYGMSPNVYRKTGGKNNAK